MTGRSLTIDHLPNEILLQILASLSTPNLLPLAVLSSRFYALVLRLFKTRLTFAASLQGRELLIEVCQPVWRRAESALCCTHLGTPNLDDFEGEYGVAIGNSKQTDTEARDPARRFKELRALYTHFRPHTRVDCITPPGSRVRPRHPAGDIPGSRTHPDTIAAERAELYGNNSGAESPIVAGNGDPGSDPNTGSSYSNSYTRNGSSAQGTASASGSSQATGHEAAAALTRVKGDAGQKEAAGRYSPPLVLSKHIIHLLPHESFSQLITVATLITRGPQSGLVRSVMPVSQGVLRLWRDWLSEARERTEAKSDAMDHERVVWVNDGPQNVGVKLGVHRRAARQPELRTWRDPGSEPDELPTSYDIEYEEVLVRTTSLLLLTEKIWEEQGLAEISVSVLGARGNEVFTGRWR